MVRNSITLLSQASDSRLIWRRILPAIIIVLLLPTLLTHFVLWRLEWRLNVKIHRKPLFILIPGTVYFKNASIDWKDKIYVRSGSLALRYPLYAFLWPWFSFSLDGRALQVEFGPDLRSVVGRKEVLFDQVSAKLLVKAGQGLDVSYLDAESSTIQFHLKSRGNSSTFHPSQSHQTSPEINETG